MSYFNIVKGVIIEAIVDSKIKKVGNMDVNIDIKKGCQYRVNGTSEGVFSIKNMKGNIMFFSKDEFSKFFKFPDFMTGEKSETKSEIKTPAHYDNSKGTLYKIAQERGWNAYLFDVVKRLERAEKKGVFNEDLDKSIAVIQLWKKERNESK